MKTMIKSALRKRALSGKRKAEELVMSKFTLVLFLSPSQGDAGLNESQNFWMAAWVYKPPHMTLEATCLCACHTQQGPSASASSLPWREWEHDDRSSSPGPSFSFSSSSCWCPMDLQQSSPGWVEENRQRSYRATGSLRYKKTMQDVKLLFKLIFFKSRYTAEFILGLNSIFHPQYGR